MGGTRRGTRVTQREAAEVLGVSVEAIRKRVKRGTLRSERGPDGRRYVYLDDAPVAGGPQPPEQDALTSELRDRLRYVEGQLEAERQAHAESRRLLAAALERIPPQLEPPQEGASEAPQAPTGATEQPGRVEPQPSVEGAQEAAERSWWRRIWG